MRGMSILDLKRDYIKARLISRLHLQSVRFQFGIWVRITSYNVEDLLTAMFCGEARNLLPGGKEAFLDDFPAVTFLLEFKILHPHATDAIGVVILVKRH